MRLFTAAYFFFFCLVSLGQSNGSATVTIGAEFKTNVRAVPVQVVHKDESGIYVIFGARANGKGPRYLYKFDHELNLIAQQKQALDFDVQQRKIEYRLVPTRAGLFYISFLPSQQLFRQYFVQQVNPETLALSQPRVIQVAEDFGNQPVDYTFTSATYFGERVAVVHTFDGNVNSLPNVVVNVFDQDMQTVWGGTFQLPVIDKLLYIKDYQVDKQGIVHVLAKRYYKNIREVRDKVVNYDYMRYSLHPDGQITTQEVKTDNKLLANMRLKITEKGDIIAMGTYSEATLTALRGIYYTRWDGNSGALLKSSFTPLADDFFYQTLSDGDTDRLQKSVADGKKLEHEGFYLRRMTGWPDGSVTIFGGLYQPDLLDLDARIPDHKAVVPPGTDGDQVIIHIDKEGDIKAARNWPDAMLSDAPNYLVSPEAIIYFTVENEKIQEFSTSGQFVIPVKIGKNTVVKRRWLGTNGEAKYHDLFNWEEANGKTNLNFMMLLSANEVLMLAQRRRNQRLIKVSFERL